MNQVRRRMAVGVVWTTLTRFGIKSIGLISTLILARLLVPQDFGLVAMATSLMAALELTTAFSFDVALIRDRNAEVTHYNTVWTLNILFASFVAVALLVLAGATANFYSEPRLETVIYVLAAAAFVRGFENIGVVDFRKELNFQKDFRLRMAQKIISFAVAIPLAFALRTYWALIAGMLASNVALVVLSYVMHPFRPRLSLDARKELFGFSKWLFANNLIAFLRHRAIDFVIGRFGGTRPLGLFKVAYEISTLPTMELVAPINRAVFPGYAKMSHDLRMLADSYIEVLAFIALAALPAGFGIAITADLLVPTLLGPRWADAAPLVAVLAMYGATMALLTNAGSVFYALGRPHIVTWTGLANVVTLLPALVAGVYLYGSLGAAWAYLGHLLVFTVPLSFTVVLKVLQLRPSRLLAVLWRPVIATAGMYLVVRESSAGYRALFGVEHPLGLLLLEVATGALSYAVLILLLWLLADRPAGPERILLNRLPWPRSVAKPVDRSSR